MVESSKYVWHEDDRICHDYDDLSEEELRKLLEEREKELYGSK